LDIKLNRGKSEMAQGDNRTAAGAATILGETVREHAKQGYDGQLVFVWDAADPLPDDGEGAGAPVDLGGGRRGPGRPPGAQNKATEEFRRFVRARYGDPLLRLMERVFADPRVLARALAADPWDVFKAQSEWMLRLLPYMHSAMPAELKVATKGRLAVAIGNMPGLPAGDRAVTVNPMQALIEFAQENQGFSVTLEAESNAGRSNVEAENPTDSKG
jgi:hypothetical protein